LSAFPVATVCSYEAMMRFGENRNGVHEWLAAFLALFNFVTFFGASQITIFTAMALAGRLLQR
jgi:hypothetical protein